MNKMSLPRLTIVLWFFNYTLLSLVSYIFANGRHAIMDYIVWASVWVAIELICLGLIEDVVPEGK